MTNQVTGQLIQIGMVVQIPSKSGGQPFLKREFLLDATTYDHYTGERSIYENILPLELSGDKCGELDRFSTGDMVTVSFVLQGRQWTTSDGQAKRMVSIRCYKIEHRNKPQQVAAPQQAAPQPQPAPQYQAPPQQFPPSVDAYGNPLPADNLPF